MKTHRLFTLGLLLILLPGFALRAAPVQLPDGDFNGLDDAWEFAYFGVRGNDATADNDRDGRNNLQECISGTDPTDPGSSLKIKSVELTSSGGEFSWDSVLGKTYRIDFTTSLDSWGGSLEDSSGDSLLVSGNGGTLTFGFSASGDAFLSGGATREVWLSPGVADLDAFKTDVLNWSDVNSPAAAGAADPVSGTEMTVGVEAPSEYANNYGQRLCGFITAPESGDYTFYIAGHDQSEFWLSSATGTSDPFSLQLVLSQSNASIGSNDWTYHSDNGLAPNEQKSSPVTLVAGERYYFEVLHVNNGPNDHVSLGWTTPSDSAGQVSAVPGNAVSAMVDFDGSNASSIAQGDNTYVRVSTFGPNSPESLDTDSDGIDDATENMLEDYNPFDAFSAGNGTGDLSELTVAMQNSTSSSPGDVITVAALDAEGREDSASDRIRFRFSRSGGIAGYTIFYTLSGTSAPLDENGAEASDYNEENSGGSPLNGSVTLPAGGNAVDVYLDPVEDSIHEYPEVVTITIDDHANYDPNPAASSATGLIYDQANIAENETLFVGFSIPQPGAPNPQQGSAVVSGKLSANKDELTLFTSITAGFSSPQNNSHVHKDVGNPGADPVTFSLPPTGEISDLVWPLSNSGSYSPQSMIDSLFNQVNETTTPGETKVYVNWHTVNNPAGELYAFLVPAVGSIEPPVPPAPPVIAHIDPVTQETELRREIVRFLNQATFGATNALVDQLYDEIVAETNQDRMVVFENFLDTQLDGTQTPQTRIFDVAMAADWHEWTARGYYDGSFFEPGDWGNNGNYYEDLPYPGDLHLDLASENWPGVDNWQETNLTTINNTLNNLDYTNPSNHLEPTSAWPIPFGNDGNGNLNNVTPIINVSYRGNQFGLGRTDRNNHRRAMWTAMIGGKDQVRQKLAFAWSQIMVISSQDPNTNNFYYGASKYWDMLAENADDSFNEMLAGVSYSPMMGNYLSHLRNQKEADLDNDGNPDVFPDENYAREIMQLFSIGLFVLHLDGSLALDSDNGLPQPTYNNTDITELSRVMTGLGHSHGSSTNWHNPGNTGTNENAFNTANGNRWYGSQFLYPMKMFGNFHDDGVKVIAGGVTIDNTSANNGTTNTNNDNDLGNADLNDVHDWFAGSGLAPGTPAGGSPTYDGHPSTPAFIAFRLIQRLYTSNPSREYVYRVAKVFNDTGGDLGEVAKAVFLDYEARTPGAVANVGGRKKPPLEAYIQMVRALEGTTQTPVSEFGGNNTRFGATTDFKLSSVQTANFTTDSFFRYPTTDGTLSMSPQRSETVFNFYLPTYAPGGIISYSSLVAPEFQIFTETSAVQNLNYFYSFTWNGTSTATGQGLQTIPNQGFWGYPNNADHIVPDRSHWIDLYPTSGPEWERDKALVDALDNLLCAGYLQETYALDPVDRTPSGGPVVVDANQNPYEAIIDALTESYSTSSNGVRDKVRLALYLMVTSPAYQIQK
ncbi:MAG: DUF1800 family protein [Verrucomicrobiota bacterium]